MKWHGTDRGRMRCIGHYGPMRLNLGSGQTAVPDWTNIDRSPNILLDRVPAVKRMLFRAGLLTEGHMQPWDREVIRQDIRKLPYPDNSVEAIYSSHTLEHLYLREAERVIGECARVLQPGGLLRLALPDVEQFARQLLSGYVVGGQDAGRHFNSQLLAHPEERPTLTGRLRSAVGGHVHRWQPSAPLVRQLMVDAGLLDVCDCAFRQGKLPGLDSIETREESFFLEGRKMS